MAVAVVVGGDDDVVVCCCSVVIIVSEGGSGYDLAVIIMAVDVVVVGCGIGNDDEQKEQLR